MRMRDPLDPVAYARACETNVPIELEAFSYHSCPFVRSRSAAKTKRLHVIERLLQDTEPSVVANAVDNPSCTRTFIERASSSLLIHSHNNWHVVWESLIRHTDTPEPMRTLFRYKERERRRQIRKEENLPPLPELAPPKPTPLGRFGERRVMLSILQVHELNKNKPGGKRIPWHITPAGWREYAGHWSKKVRDATKRHPKCPRSLRKKKR